MLHCELFLNRFRAVDHVTRRPMYLGDFVLSRPGYNDHGRGQRVLYVGDDPPVQQGTEAIDRLLDALDFASAADRTDAVAAALTVLLRNRWPGAKPMVVLTSNKSHAGKDTVVALCSGRTPKVSISYESTDWPVQRAFVNAVKLDQEIGVVNVENVRLGNGTREVASPFLERFLTDPEPLLDSPGTGAPVRRANHWVLTLTMNAGRVSDDLMNRSLPIHLVTKGDVAARRPAIGNPKLEYLPANCDRIEAELRGMIEKWIMAGRPLDTSVMHPFTEWAQTVGGILMVNGYKNFLGNYGVRKSVDEPIRQALGRLGAALPDEWRTASQWVPLVAHAGLTDPLIPKADRESADSRARGLGVVLSAHDQEMVIVETDGEELRLRLEKARRRFDGKVETRYRFVTLDRQVLPET